MQRPIVFYNGPEWDPMRRQRCNCISTQVRQMWASRGKKNRYQHEVLRFCILLRSCCTIHLCTELVLSKPRKNELCPAHNPIACIEHLELDQLAFGVDCNTTKFRLQVVIAISPRTSRYSHRRKLGWSRLLFFVRSFYPNGCFHHVL